MGLPWGTPKSSMLIGFPIINHPFRGYQHLWKPLIWQEYDNTTRVAISLFQSSQVWWIRCGRASSGLGPSQATSPKGQGRHMPNPHEEVLASKKIQSWNYSFDFWVSGFLVCMISDFLHFRMPGLSISRPLDALGLFFPLVFQLCKAQVAKDKWLKSARNAATSVSTKHTWSLQHVTDFSPGRWWQKAVPMS